MDRNGSHGDDAVSALVLLFRAVDGLIGQAGSLDGYGEASQHHADIWEHWDGELDLAERKRNGQAPVFRVHMTAVRTLCFYDELRCDSPACLEFGFEKGFDRAASASLAVVTLQSMPVRLAIHPS